MRILGIDPGYATIGYGIIDYSHGRFSVAGFGAITTKAVCLLKSGFAIYITI